MDERIEIIDDDHARVTIRALGCDVTLAMTGDGRGWIERVAIISPDEYLAETGDPMTLEGLTDSLTDEAPRLERIAIRRLAELREP